MGYPPTPDPSVRMAMMERDLLYIKEKLEDMSKEVTSLRKILITAAVSITGSAVLFAVTLAVTVVQ